MLKVQAMTLGSKLTGSLGGRCPLQSLGRPPILGPFGDGKNAGHDPYREGPPVRGVRINVMRMVSKYVGETEQNLEPA